MNLVNATPLEAGYTLGIQPDGRELLVVVVKGTFKLPAAAGEPSLAETQVPLIETDQFTGEPGFSAPLYEIDFAPKKPRCDVLLNGSAYAPHGRPVERVNVALRVGSWRKSFAVVGNRTWVRQVLSFGASSPEPFTTMPISYGNAFGGIDRGEDESETDHYFPKNHVGVGYHVRKSAKLIEGKPLPNTEEDGGPIRAPNGDYSPMAFGPIGRAWKQRIQYAGTYDKHWLDNVCPFLPDDFRDEYYQAAPADQWIDYPKGGEEVEMHNLAPQGYSRFTLPTTRVPVEFFRKDGERVEIESVVDTLLFEPDQGRFTMSARCALPLKKNIHEMHLAVVGKKPRRWYEEEGLVPRRAPEKRRYESLDALVKSRNS
jgi:hypothetical protein